MIHQDGKKRNCFGFGERVGDDIKFFFIKKRG